MLFSNDEHRRFLVKKSLNEIIMNDTMSDDEIVASDVPLQYLFFLFLFLFRIIIFCVSFFFFFSTFLSFLTISSLELLAHRE